MRLKGKLSLKRMAIALAILCFLFWLFYLWQPYRFQWIDKTPKTPLPVIPIEQTGLYVTGKRVLIVTGHPDDDAYFIGGALLNLKDREANMRLIVCTNGDKGYYFWSDTTGVSKTRQQEERDCAKKAGIEEVLFLNKPDSRMSVDDDLVGRLTQEINDFKPECILTFDPHFPHRVNHRDHLAAGVATLKAAENANYKGEFLLFATVNPNTAADVTNHWPEVEDLLAAHKSQFHGERLTMIRNSVRAYAVEAGERFGPPLAEAFRACKLK